MRQSRSTIVGQRSQQRINVELIIGTGDSRPSSITKQAEVGRDFAAEVRPGCTVVLGNNRAIERERHRGGALQNAAAKSSDGIKGNGIVLAKHRPHSAANCDATTARRTVSGNRSIPNGRFRVEQIDSATTKTWRDEVGLVVNHRTVS